jgi:uncharacterized protein
MPRLRDSDRNKISQVLTSPSPTTGGGDWREILQHYQDRKDRIGMHLSRIILYPIKSLDGVSVSEARMTEGGVLEHDRVYAIMDAEGKYVNGKRNDRVHRIRSHFSEDFREVFLGDRDAVTEERFMLADPNPINRWLSAFFGFPAQLRHEPRSGFPDDLEAYGPTVVGEASLMEVASWYPGLCLESVRRRFRTNLEIDGEEIAFCEDQLYGAPGELRPFNVGEVQFMGHNPCQRCVVPTRDPDGIGTVSGFQKEFMRRRQESLPPWADARRFNHYYRFAVNTSVPPGQAGMTLRLGDTIQPDVA